MKTVKTVLLLFGGMLLGFAVATVGQPIFAEPGTSLEYQLGLQDFGGHGSRNQLVQTAPYNFSFSEQRGPLQLLDRGRSPC